MPGKVAPIRIYTGPMFSQKSFQLINDLTRAKRATKKILAVVPKRDTRNRTRIKCRIQDPETGKLTTMTYIHAENVSGDSPEEFLDLVHRHEFDILGVDEVQFFGEWFVDFVKDLAWNESNIIGGNAPWRRGYARTNWAGKKVILAGLDLTAWRTAFGITPELLNIADEVVKLTADCFKEECSNTARFTQLVVDKTELPDRVDADNPVLIGDYGTYEARCGDCWRPPLD